MHSSITLPSFSLKNYDPTRWQSFIKPELIYRYRVLPLDYDNSILQLGIADPTNYAAISAISFHTGVPVRVVSVDETELNRVIDTFYRPNTIDSELEKTLSKISTENGVVSQEETLDEPVIQFVDYLIKDAIEKNVSDIHIEPYEKMSRIRFRRDGLLFEITSIPTHLSTRVMTRLKIMGNLNIAEKRLPQDGRIHLRFENKIDLRINVCPTLYGEKIVLRLLNSGHVCLKLDDLGLNPTQKDLLLKKLELPQGLIFVTGPTGSGKTATLYAALQHLNQIEKNISTIEDPVEIELPGINQINIHPQIGLDFANILRALLRQDPDIIMVGEVRDKETAKIAVEAAETGHLVLSTLHTNSAIETILRLASLGVDAHHMIHSLSLLIAQRLVRKLCERCKQTTIPDNYPFNLRKVYEPHGCKYCHQGYLGRVGIFECLALTQDIIQLILSVTQASNITECIKTINNQFLWNAGLEKVREGITSLTELKRVMGETKCLQ